MHPWAWCALAVLAAGSARPWVIEDFDHGVVLESFPGEDLQPQCWALDSLKTPSGSGFCLCLFGNTWKTEAVGPIQVDSGAVWQVAALTVGSVDIHGFGLMDSAHCLFYSLAGTRLLDPQAWVTVYQGAFPAGQWWVYQLPVADDWLASFGYLPRVERLVFVCDRDSGGEGLAFFDDVWDITQDLPQAPRPSVGYTVGALRQGPEGSKVVDVSFWATVEDPDSDLHWFSWDFGDGTGSADQNPTHTYLVSDDHPYRVVLAVRDPTQRWGWATCTVQVDSGPSTLPITVNFVGDVMLARGYEQPGGIIPTQGVEAIFQPTLALLGGAANLTVANLESPLTTATSRHPTKPICFKGSPQNVAGLVYAGIDVVSIANNHIYDYLDSGLVETKAVLAQAGVLAFGAGMHSYEASLPVSRTLSGITLAFVGCSDRTGQYGNYQPYLNAGLNKPGFAFMTAFDVARQVQAARPHADLVVVATHSGEEYGLVPRLDPSELADPLGDEDDVGWNPRPSARNRLIRQAAIDAGADLVVSHHPHVLQGLEVYNGKLIAHSLGNFTFDLRYPETFPSLILQAEADETGFCGYQLVPVYIDDWIPRPAHGRLAIHILDYVARRSRELGTVLYVDREAGRATVHVDTLGVVVQERHFRTQTSLEPLGSWWVSPPLRLAWRGHLSRVDSVAGAGPWEYRVGRSLLWWGSCEDEGATMWNLNSTSEAYDTTQSLMGHRSIRHRRTSSSSGPVVTNLEWRLKRFEVAPMTLQGWVRTSGAGPSCVEVQYYATRYGGVPLGSEQTPVVSGTNPWVMVWEVLEVPPEAAYYDVRVRSDPPGAGEGFSWFDEVDLVEWSAWCPVSQVREMPHDWCYLQVRSPVPQDSACVWYTEAAWGPVPCPQASVSPCTLSVQAPPGSQVQRTVVVRNAGDGTLGLVTESSVEWAWARPRACQVSPGASVPLVVTFAAQDTGSWEGVLHVRTDDPGSPVLGVVLQLQGGLAPVSDLSVQMVGRSAHLRWSPVPCDAYRVYRAAAVGGPWVPLAVVTQPWFVDTDVQETLPQAFYRVTALQGGLGRARASGSPARPGAGDAP